MGREPDELVEMRRVLGAELVAFRRAAALNQRQLAIAAVVDLIVEDDAAIGVRASRVGRPVPLADAEFFPVLADLPPTVTVGE